MDSPERRAPIKPNWEGILASPGSAAFMDLCDSLSPIRPVPTFHASTYNDLANQMRSPPSPSFPTRRLKEKRFASSSAAALLAAATSEEAPKTPGLLKREPLRQTFGRNLSRIGAANPEFKSSLSQGLGFATDEQTVEGLNPARNQVRVEQQGGGCVGDLESKADVGKSPLQSVRNIQSEATQTRECHNPQVEKAAGIVKEEGAASQMGCQSSANASAARPTPSELEWLEKQQRPSSKRDKEELNPADNIVSGSRQPAFLKSLKAAVDPLATSSQPHNKKPEPSSFTAPLASSGGASTISTPTPNPVPSKPIFETKSLNEPLQACAAPLPSDGRQQVPAGPACPPTTSSALAEESGQDAKRQKLEAGEEAEVAPELQREPSFAMTQGEQWSSGKDGSAPLEVSTVVTPSAMELTPATPPTVAALKDAPVGQRQTRSQTLENESSDKSGGVLGVPLPRGKRTMIGRKKSQLVHSGGEESSAAEDPGVSSDDTERTVSMGEADLEESAQGRGDSRIGTGAVGDAVCSLERGGQEAGSCPDNGEESQPTHVREVNASEGRQVEASTEVQGESSRHASPERTAVASPLKGVRSPRKGIRKGRETPGNGQANRRLPPGAAKEDTEEDVARLLVDLSEGRTPEKEKRQGGGAGNTPTSGLVRSEACGPAPRPNSLDATEAGCEQGNATGMLESARANQLVTGGEATGIDGHSKAAVSLDQAATPGFAMLAHGKNGASSPGPLGGRARRLDFDADAAARRQSLTTHQNPRLSLEAQGSWPGFVATQTTLGSPSRSPVYASVAHGSSTPETRNGTPQSGRGPLEGSGFPSEVNVKQEENEEGSWRLGQKRSSPGNGAGEREAKRERTSFAEGAHEGAKIASDATAVALSAAMGALSACRTPATCQAAAGGPSHQISGGIPTHPGLKSAPAADSKWPQERNPAGQEAPMQSPLVVTAVSAGAAVQNIQRASWSVGASLAAPPAYSVASRGVTPSKGRQGFATPPASYGQQKAATPPPPARQNEKPPQKRAAVVVTSAAAPVTSAGPNTSAPFDPNVAIVPKAPPPPQQPRNAKALNLARPSGSLNLARLGAGLSAGTVVRVNAGGGPVPQEHHSHLPGKPCTAQCGTGPPHYNLPQPYMSPRFPQYSQYMPSYQKAPSRAAAAGYQNVVMPFGQKQGPPGAVSPAFAQRQKMEAAIDRREAQHDPLSELELELDLDVEVMVVKESPPQPKKTSSACKRCHCKKSRCLKLYCECFAASVYCTGCDCTDCQNRPEFENIVMDKKEEIERKDPNAFTPKIVEGESPSPTKGAGETPASAKHKKGCHCKKSMCQKKYCECFQAGVPCTDACRCESCANVFGTKCSHNHGRNAEPSTWAAPAEPVEMRSPVTPGFGRISIQRTFPGGGKMVSKKQSLDPHGDEISALDFPHHHPTKEKPAGTPPKPEPAAPATSAKGRGRKEKVKSDLKTVRENKCGAAEQTSSGMFPGISSSPARWSLAPTDFSPASQFYPPPPSPATRRGSDTTEFLHMPSSPSPSFGSGPLLRTGTGMGATPHSKVRSTPLGAVVWNPAEMARDPPAERRIAGFRVPESGGKAPGGMLKLSNLTGASPPRNMDPQGRYATADCRGHGRSQFDTGYANATGLTCDESVDLDASQDPLAESFFMDPSDYGADGDPLCSYESGQLELGYSEVVYEDSPKPSVPVSPPPKTQQTGPSFVNLRNLSGASGRHYNEDPDDPSVALLSPPQDGKHRRSSIGLFGARSTGEVVEDGFASGEEATPIRISQKGSPTKVMAPAYSWRGSPARGLMATPGKRSLNLSMLPSLPTLPARLSGGEGSGLFTSEGA